MPPALRQAALHTEVNREKELAAGQPGLGFRDDVGFFLGIGLLS